MRAGARFRRALLLPLAAGALAPCACTAILGIGPLPDESGADAADDASSSPDASADPASDATADAASDVTADASCPPSAASDAAMTFGYLARAIPIAPLAGLEGANLRYGESLAFSPDGTWLAIGAPGAGRSDADAGLTGQVQLVRILVDSSGAGTVSSTLLDQAGLDPPAVADGGFGRSVAFSPDGRYLAVGAPQEPHEMSTITGNVYLYQLECDHWAYLMALKPSSIESATWFGNAVAFNGVSTAPGADILFVGATGDGGTTDTAQASVNAYRFLDGGLSSPVTATSSQPHDGFGWSIASSASADVILVGAPFERDPQTPNFEDGRVYLLSLAQFQPSTQAGFSINHPEATVYRSALFGSSIAVSFDGTTAVIGAPGSISTGLVEVWQIDAGTAGQAGPPTFAADAAETFPVAGSSLELLGAYFGTSVAVDQDSILMGVPFNGRDSSVGECASTNLSPPYMSLATERTSDPTSSPDGGSLAGSLYGSVVATIFDGGLVAVSAPGSADGGPPPLVYLTR